MPRKKKIIPTKKITAELKGLKVWIIACAAAFLLIFVGMIPLSGLLLNLYKDDLVSYIERSYSGNIHVGDISGNILSGIALSDVYFLPEGDEVTLPVWTGDRIIVHLRILPLFAGKVIPRRVVFDQFVLRFEQDKDGSFKLPPLFPQPYSAQGGRFQMQDIGIVLKNCKAVYMENEVFVKTKPLKFELDKIDVSAWYRSQGKLRINNLKGTILNSKISIKGDIDTKNDYKSSLVLEAKDLGLWQITEALGRLFPTEEKLRPSGTGEMKVKISNTLKSPVFEGKCYLADMTIGNFHLEETHFQVELRDKVLQLHDGVSKAYDGRIALSIKIDDSVSPPVFTIDADMKNIDFGEYLKETASGIDPVSGTFSGSFQGSGNFKEVESFMASGKLNCVNGMYLNPFKGAASGLFSKRQEPRRGFDNLVLDYGISDGKFFCREFKMAGSGIEIEASGDISFKGIMNLDGIIRADSDLFKANQKFSEIISFLPVKSLKIPVKFRLSGSPSNYVIHTAFPEETINEILGDDAARKQAAQMLLEQYFGENAGQYQDSVPQFSNDFQ